MAIQSAQNVVHVGLGKTASTSLQKLVFPAVAGLRDDVVFNDTALTTLLGNLVGMTALPREEGDFRSLLNSAQHFISMETLAGGIPESWEQRADSNLRLFGPHTTIILTLRPTEAWLRSAYQQAVMQGYVIPPESFFVNQDEYIRLHGLVAPRNPVRFNVDSFDLEYLHRLYIERFDDVVIVPYEQIGSLGFLKKIFELTENDLARLRKILAAGKRHNRSYSSTAMNLTLAREKFLGYFGLASRDSTEDRIRRALASARDITPPPRAEKPWKSTPRTTPTSDLNCFLLSGAESATALEEDWIGVT